MLQLATRIGEIHTDENSHRYFIGSIDDKNHVIDLKDTWTILTNRSQVINSLYF